MSLHSSTGLSPAPFRSELMDPSLWENRVLDLGLPAPHPALRSCVIVPVRNEEVALPVLISALADQRDLQGRPLDPAAYEVILLLNNCTDLTAAIARSLQRCAPRLHLHFAEIEFAEPEAHVGRARQVLFDWACRRFHASRKPHGLILTTDADSQPAPDWIARNEAEIAQGVSGVGGRILLDPRQRARMNPRVRRLFLLDVGYRRALEELRSLFAPQAHDPFPHHHQHFGASLAVVASAYAKAGGMPLRRSSEDVALYQAILDSGQRFRHSDRVRVLTSARAIGRAQGGLADAISWWSEQAVGDKPVIVESAEAALDRFGLLGLWCADHVGQPAPTTLTDTPCLESGANSDEIYHTLQMLRVICETLRPLSLADRLQLARNRQAARPEIQEAAA